MKSGALILVIFTLFSCGGKKSEPVVHITPEKDSVYSFFPVTSYIKGQVFEMQQYGINPLKFSTVGNKTDSQWLKIEEVLPAIEPFLSPVIDSTNLQKYFTQTGFLDQTLNAYTFSYDPTALLPDTFPLKHWDVYVNPESNKVQRIYMLKKERDHQVQLTWIAGKQCKMVWIQDGEKPTVDKEILLKWDFDE